MRHGHVRRESLLYVVVAATRPTYCGVIVAAMVWLTGVLVCPADASAGQRANKKVPAPPFAALFPLEEAWTVTLPTAPATAAAHDGERVFVPLTSNALVALDWESGQTKWTAPVTATAVPVVSAGTVYVASGTLLLALDAATGTPRWTGRAERPLRTLGLAGTRLVGAGSSFVQAFEAASGQALWSRPLSEGLEPVGLAAGDSAVFLAFRRSEDAAAQGAGHVMAFALADGREQWTRSLTGAPTMPLFARERVYVGATDNRFSALDAKTGKVDWSWRTGGDVTGAAADVKAVYYTSLDAVVRAVNPGNGHQRWKRDASTRAIVPPVALDGSLLVTGLTPMLSAFAPLTGAPQGTFDLPGEVHGSPLVSAALLPRAVAVVVVLKDGRAFGMRSLTLLFNESAPQPFSALPGTPLTRERLPELPPASVPSSPDP
jgi:outer membrane protein assembly factor BamB